MYSRRVRGWDNGPSGTFHCERRRSNPSEFKSIVSIKRPSELPSLWRGRESPSTDAIRVRGSSTRLDRNPSPQTSSHKGRGNALSARAQIHFFQTARQYRHGLAILAAAFRASLALNSCPRKKRAEGNAGASKRAAASRARNKKANERSSPR